MAEPDYYGVLGVAPDSEDIVIQAAYRALMRRYHPDKNPTEAARKRTVEINAAYAVLSDPAKRAAYDARRESNARQKNAGTGAKSPPPPPPPPPKSATGKPAPPPVSVGPSGGRGGIVFASVITLSLLGGFVLSVSNSSDVANNTMNVDENLTTTDMNATTAYDDKSAVMTNADAALNAAAEASAPDLSQQQPTPVDYSTIESAARKVAKLIATKGIAGARAYSEDCHKGVLATPSWTGADSCAAFDYAAAYIDGAVTTQAGWPKNGYFDFQSENQSDEYAAAGAASYRTYDRLPKIKAAAQQAGLEAFRTELARQDAITRARENQKTPATTASSPDNSSE